MTWGLCATGGLIAISLIGLPIAGINAQAIINSGILKDTFAAANLQADIHWSFADCLLGILLLTTLIVSLIFLYYYYTSYHYVLLHVVFHESLDRYRYRYYYYYYCSDFSDMMMYNDADMY